ncbi:P-loop containing nucleoside triphosphate hydrolase protein [Hypoxylon sp. FL1857]|nr:P-loop containing nucleoside triphosphate hydrolase protein [Hypoxylon sp. FL1857]
MAPPPSYATPSHEVIMEDEVLEITEPRVPSVPNIPITKNFSFTIPSVFKPSSSTVIRWIDNLPIPAEQERPLERTSFQAPKHPLDASQTSLGHDEDDHIDKKPKRDSASTTHPGLEKRRSIISESSRKLMNRVSAVYRRLTTTREAREAMRRFSIDMSPSFATTSLSDRPRESMRFIIVGDAGCGKSNLLLRFYRDTFDLTYTKTRYELFTKTIDVDGKEVDLELWDTSGEIGLQQIQSLSYLSWDTVFLCYSMENVDVFMKSQEMWVNQIRKHCGGAPVVLVGLKKDTRRGTGLFAPLRPDLRARLCSIENEYGDVLMRTMKYLECSAMTGENVERVFEEATRAVLADRGHDEEIARTHSRLEVQEAGGISKFMCFK